ncbi:hypothetical protein BKH31_06710, partial [Actinomyces oris]
MSVLVGAGLPVLAACDPQEGPQGKGGSASPSASASGPAQAGSTQWQKLDGHIMGHKVTAEVSPVIR